MRSEVDWRRLDAALMFVLDSNLSSSKWKLEFLQSLCHPITSGELSGEKLRGSEGLMMINFAFRPDNKNVQLRGRMEKGLLRPTLVICSNGGGSLSSIFSFYPPSLPPLSLFHSCSRPSTANFPDSTTKFSTSIRDNFAPHGDATLTDVDGSHEGIGKGTVKKNSKVIERLAIYPLRKTASLA